LGTAPAVTTPRAPMLWAGILAGPLAFAADLLARYALVHSACADGQTTILTLITMVSMAVICGGAAVAWRAWQLTATAASSGGRPVDRAKFMAVSGVLSSALFAIVVGATAYPQWVLDACR
jgi:hypothetical protein